jgi:hypothetical protein
VLHPAYPAESGTEKASSDTISGYILPQLMDRAEVTITFCLYSSSKMMDKSSNPLKQPAEDESDDGDHTSKVLL